MFQSMVEISIRPLLTQRSRSKEKRVATPDLYSAEKSHYFVKIVAELRRIRLYPCHALDKPAFQNYRIMGKLPIWKKNLCRP